MAILGLGDVQSLRPKGVEVAVGVSIRAVAGLGPEAGRAQHELECVAESYSHPRKGVWGTRPPIPPPSTELATLALKIPRATLANQNPLGRALRARTTYPCGAC